MRELPPCALDLQAHLVLVEGPPLWYDRIHKLNNLAAKAIEMWYIFGDKHILYTVYPAKLDLEMPGEVSYAVRVDRIPVAAGTKVTDLHDILTGALEKNHEVFEYLGNQCHPHMSCISVPIVQMNSQRAADWQWDRMPVTGIQQTGPQELTLLKDEDAATAELEATMDELFRQGFNIESMPYVI